MNIQNKNSSNKNLSKLIKVVSRLRDPIRGCPWDIKQTHKSLIKYAIEEAHEVEDAIKYGNDENLIDELGDLLLQIIIHAQIANEEKRFCFDDIALAASNKMIRRHPHVFGNKKTMNLQEVKESWEEIKIREQNLSESKNLFTEQCSHKLRSKSSFCGAIFLSKKLLEKGIEFIAQQLLWNKIENDIKNLKKNVKNRKPENSSENLGDLLFKIIHLSNYNNLNPEESLMETNTKILNRLRDIESESNGNLLDKIPSEKLDLFS